MKKQIVLSLSVLVLALTTEVAYAIRGERRGGAETSMSPQTDTSATKTQQQQPSSADLTSAEAVAAAGVTLNDVVAVLQDMGANASMSTAAGKAKASSFISTGQASASSSNKSHKLGRLSR